MKPEMNPVEKMILVLSRHPLGISPVRFLTFRRGFPLLLFLLRHRYACLAGPSRIVLSRKGETIAKRLTHRSAAVRPVLVSIPQSEPYSGEDYDACV